MDSIVRCESSVSRQQEKAIQRLERLQEARQAESNQFEPSDIDSNNAISDPDEATEEISEAPEDFIAGHPQHGSSTTAQQDVEATVTRESATTDEDPSNVPAETTASEPPPPGNCGQNAGAQSLAAAIEQVMDPTPPEQHESGVASRENRETDGVGSSCWVETAEDA
jgi:hypothetical protein